MVKEIGRGRVTEEDDNNEMSRLDMDEWSWTSGVCGLAQPVETSYTADVQTSTSMIICRGS